MKKLLSVILAGALALTAVSPAFAATEAYENSEENGLYYDVDFADATSVEYGGTLNSFINSASNGELRWESRNGSSTITKASDPIKGDVAKITSAAGLHSRLWFDKGNYKNGWDGTTDTWTKSSTIVEFSFKVENPTKNMFFYAANSDSLPENIFYPTGSFKGSRSSEVANAYYTNGDWNHCVIEFGTYHTGVGIANNSLRVWLNGVRVCDGGSSDRTSQFSSESWNNTYLAFGVDGATEAQEWYIADITKYETADQSSVYKPADAGNVAPTLTSSNTALVVVDDTNRTINYDRNSIETADQIAELLNTTSVALLTTDGYFEEDVDMFADYEVANVSKILGVSTSGDALSTYSVAPLESITFTADAALTVDTAARTIKGSVTDFPTVADVRAAITVTEGKQDFVIYAGDAVAEETAAATTITSIVITSANDYVTHTYTVSIRSEEKVFWDIDFKDYVAEDWDSASAFAAKDGVRVRMIGGATFTAVDDAEVGHQVAKITASTLWAGLDDPYYWDCDVAEGDYVIMEAVVKMADQVAGNPDMIFNSNSYKFFDFGRSSARTTIANMNGSISYEAGKWYHLVLQMQDGSPIYTWVNGEPAGTSYWPRSASALNVPSFWGQVTSLTAGNNGDASPLALRGTSEWYLKKYKLMRSNEPYDAEANGDLAELTSSADGALTVDSGVVLYEDDEMTVADFKDTIGKSTGATVVVYSDDVELSDEDIICDATSALVRSASTNRFNTYALASKTASLPQVTWGTGIAVDETAKTVAFAEKDAATIAGLKALVTEGDGTTVAYKDASGTALADSASTLDLTTITATKGSVVYTYSVTVTPATTAIFDYDWAVSTKSLGTYTSPLCFRYGVSGANVDDADMGYKVWRATPNSTTWGGISHGSALGTMVAEGEKIIIEATIKPSAANQADNVWMTLANDVASNAFYTPFDFGCDSAQSVIYTHGDRTTGFPYEAGKWYHIVSEYTPTASGSTVRQWINGNEVASSTHEELTLTFWNTSTSGPGGKNERIRIQKGNTTGASAPSWDTAKFAVYRSAFGYDPASDAASVTSTSSSVVVDQTKATISLIDATMTVADLKDVMTVSAGATVKYVKADGTEAADTDSAATVVALKSLSASKNQHISYTVAVTDTVSSVYNVNYTDMTISGVLQQTTADMFVSNITVNGSYTLNSAGKYVADGDTLVTGSNTFTIKLDRIRHADGDTSLKGTGDDGLHLGLMSGAITETIATDDAIRGGSYLKYTGAEGGNYWRLNFRAEDTSNNGSGYPALKEGEFRNIEFSFKSDSGTHWGLIFNGTWAFNVKGEDIALNQNVTSGYFLPQKYTPGEWMHVAISFAWLEGTPYVKQKIYLDGEFVCECDVSTGNHNDGIGLWIANGLFAGADFAIDDIKIWDSAVWGIDMDYYYGEGITSTSDDVVVANSEVWLANGAKVSDGISVDAFDATGAAVDLSTLVAGDTFYVKQLPFIKKYTVMEGALGSEVSAEGTLTVTIGTVEDAEKPAIFVAGVHADGKFSDIYKVAKEDTAGRGFSTADTITYDLNKLGATGAKVYIWDSSLRTLADVAEFVCTDGVWSAK